MTKIAKLVTISLTVRVIVDEDATEEQIIDAAKPKMRAMLNEEVLDHLEKIKDDKECPFGTFEKDNSPNANELS